MPNKPDFLLIIVHLLSKVNTRDTSQALDCPKHVARIQEAERQVGHRRTLLIGDLNMNPFEPGVVAATGFHATMSRRIAMQNPRTVQGDIFHFFYNPMWSLMGNHPHMRPPGTHYYRHGETVSYLWNTFD